MAILSDRQIKARCMKPTHYYCNDAGVWGPAIAGVTHPVEQLDAWERRNWHRSMVVTDKVIEQHGWKPMITPFLGTSVKVIDDAKIISKGVSSFGYDVTLALEMKLFTNINSSLIDPKRLDENCLVDAIVRIDEEGCAYVILPPNSYLLGKTVEYFHIPKNILVVCLGKSTYARAGAIVNVTPIEPGFEGNVVIEVSNSTNLPLKIYANEGISQFIFLEGTEDCEVSYADRGGKYQGQTTVQLPFV